MGVLRKYAALQRERESSGVGEGGREEQEIIHCSLFIYLSFEESDAAAENQ
jgi:hypothetical protein